jgi:hypothetical protein
MCLFRGRKTKEEPKPIQKTVTALLPAHSSFPYFPWIQLTWSDNENHLYEKHVTRESLDKFGKIARG